MATVGLTPTSRARTDTDVAPGRRPRRRYPTVIIISALALAAIFTAALLAPQLSPYEPTAQNLRARFQPPSFAGGSSGHLLGTDHLGRDMLTRVLWATRTSLMIAMLGTTVGLVVGVGLGLVSGFGRPRVDNLIMFLVDSQLAVPFTLVALVGIAIFGTHITLLIPLVGLAGWSQYARVTRGEVLAKRRLEYIEAARAVGSSDARILVKHVLPNITAPLIVLMTFNFNQIMLLESALSFLGLGVQPPAASLGSLIGTGRDYLMVAWWIAAIPSAVSVMITILMSLLGDWLRDTLDPRLQA